MTRHRIVQIGAAGVFRANANDLCPPTDEEVFERMMDSVTGSTRCTGARRYVRAILTDAQIEVLEKACARFLDDDADWLANPPTDADYEQLAGAMAALQSAEVIVP